MCRCWKSLGKYDSKSLHSLENTLGGNRDSEADAAEGSEGIEEKKIDVLYSTREYV